MSSDSKSRFSSRVDNYVRYRPGYPPGVIQTLQNNCGLVSTSIIADIGSGTGLLAQEFLKLGCTVYGVEPNREMRLAGERLLADYSGFISRDGSAEETGLPDACADFVTAGQAFHWFDPNRARIELRRIARPGAWAALVWNERRTDSTPFLRDYEALLLHYSKDYVAINHRNTEQNPDTIPNFFGGAYNLERFENLQLFDYKGLEGRLLSSSYAPETGQAGHAAMLIELKAIYNRHQQNDRVAVEYETHLYYGRIT
jgi:SAM-dependent methyltransferase